MEQSEDLTRIRDLVQHARDNTVAKPCVLCGLVTRRRVLAVGAECGRLGGPADKRRMVSFPLCHRHPRDRATGRAALQRLETALGWIAITADLFGHTSNQ